MQAMKLVMIVMVAAAASPAFADMQVLDSTDTHFTRGQHVETIDAAKLEPGSFVKVLDGTTTRTFEGPSVGSLPIGGTRGLKKLKSER